MDTLLNVLMSLFAGIYLLAVAVDCISHAHDEFHGNFHITHSFVDVKHQVTPSLDLQSS